ncbi:WD and tetratricopeptide repeats protein 1-like, partial [Stegodyphus dumicola]|uniref:WD and tetratricopeptide repeats protein 1-like n=1 Tax=Stegodyphus dumicola TaxID=202533 RepID=UPI0015B1165C
IARNHTESEDDSGAAASTSSSTSQQHSNADNKVFPSYSFQEKKWRASAYDYEARFCGHCNTTTDIKEANFFGSCGQYIVAGSDDGSIFIWDRVTTNIVRVLRGDDSIVNCLQPHPSTCLLATSGIDPVVRLWGPRAEDGSKEDREILDSDDAAFANQRRMNADPLEIMLMNMGYRLPDIFMILP